jgi:hypothetical protein
VTKPKPLPPQEELQERFNYDPETGQLTWKKPPGFRAKPGDRAGYLTTQGYLRVKWGQSHYRVHRLIWKLVYGEDPTEGIEIDHINRDRTDNRLANLRLATPSENANNSSRVLFKAKATEKPLKTRAELEEIHKRLGQKRRKPVIVIKPDGEETYYTSVFEAAKANNVSPSTISFLVTRRYKQLCNLKARYAY